MERDGRNEQCIRFGLRLASVRRHLSLTQDLLSADSGMSRSYLSGVETGKRNLGLLNICKLADAMGVLPLVLLDFDGLTDGRRRHVREPPAAYVTAPPGGLKRAGFLMAEPAELIEFKELRSKTPSLETLEAGPPGWADRAVGSAPRLAARVAALFPGGVPRRVARHVMRAAILNLLEGEFVTIRELAAALSRASEFIRGDYLRPLVEEGEVALRYPGNPSHPQQAYGATYRTGSPTAS